MKNYWQFIKKKVILIKKIAKVKVIAVLSVEMRAKVPLKIIKNQNIEEEVEVKVEAEVETKEKENQSTMINIRKNKI